MGCLCTTQEPQNSILPKCEPNLHFGGLRAIFVFILHRLLRRFKNEKQQISWTVYCSRIIFSYIIVRSRKKTRKPLKTVCGGVIFRRGAFINSKERRQIVQVLLAYDSLTMASKTARLWRESATLIIISRSALKNTNQPFDYRVLMLQRSSKSRFMVSLV